MKNIAEELIEQFDSLRKGEVYPLAITSLWAQRRPSVEVLLLLFRALYPNIFGKEDSSSQVTLNSVQRDLYLLDSELRKYSSFFKVPSEGIKEIAELLGDLPRIQRELLLDIGATYKGDPAAKSTEEIILCYPGMLAMTIHRFAHELEIRNVRILPRFLSEYAHSQTGIDIHPGARIGSSFVIDHGTGVVIGETAVIGNDVKIYQGVTIGALSIPQGENRDDLHSMKRHPTIQDRVIIYAGATILGGKTVIGEGSVIGGNSWIIESIPPYTKVVSKPDIRKMNLKKGGGTR